MSTICTTCFNGLIDSRHVLIFLVSIPALRSSTFAKVAHWSRRVAFDLSQAADFTRFLPACGSFRERLVCVLSRFIDATLSGLAFHDTCVLWDALRDRRYMDS